VLAIGAHISHLRKYEKFLADIAALLTVDQLRSMACAKLGIVREISVSGCHFILLYLWENT